MHFAPLLFALLAAPVVAAPPPTVTTRLIEAIALHPQREAPAQAVSLNRAKLSAEVASRITRIDVEPGQRIARGTVVARLDCGDLDLAVRRAQATLASTQARLALAQQQVQRSRELAAQNFISNEALDARQTELAVIAADVRVGEAALASAQRDVNKCTVRAPFPAIVEARLAQVGEWATPGFPLVELTDTSRLQLAAQLQASDADTLRGNLRFSSQGRDYPVKLLRVSPALDPASRTREARLSFGAPAPNPGSFGVLRWQDPRRWLAPGIVVRRGSQLGVFVAANDVARFVALPGAQEGRPVLADTLPAGTRVIVEGHLALQHGSRITVR